jgi:hypothetical protein
MARKKQISLPEGKSYLDVWEEEYKPAILAYHQVPIDVVAMALGVSTGTVQSQLRSGLYDYGVARPCAGGDYRYEIMPLRLIAYIEGTMNTVKNISFGEVD